MNYKKLEELFVDFILDLIGPTEERENERNTNISIIKSILINSFNYKLPDYNIYILPYGSFPFKTYLKNGDIDLTIILEKKISKKILIEIPNSFIQYILSIIKDEFVKFNKKFSFDLFTEIEIIIADINLLKCKLSSIPLDITINNFSGLNKLLFINFIEKQFNNSFNDHDLFCDNIYSNNKIIILKRTLLLIKAWLFYEGNLMGSNIGLMANYALEILILYIFNFHYECIFNEFDGFEIFFEVLEKINLENSIISFFGIISKINFYKELSMFNSDVLNNKDINQPFWYLNNENTISNGKNNILINSNNKSLLNIEEIKKYIIQMNNSIGNIYLKNAGKIINIGNYNKPVNILDPLNNHNNLGKSLIFHNYLRLKEVIVFLNKKLKNIQEIRKKGNPFLYINSLLNLFKITLSNSFISLFSRTLSTPKILENAKFFKNSSNFQKIIVDDEKVEKFNSLFIKNKNTDKITNLEIEDNDSYAEENSEKIDSEEEDQDKFAEEDYEDGDEDEDEDENNNNKEQHKFPILINNEILNKLFERKEHSQKIIDYNILLLKQSYDYSNNLTKFLKEHQIIT